MFSLGAANPQKLAEAQKSVVPLPSNRSPFFAPDYNPRSHAAVLAETTVLMDLLK